MGRWLKWYASHVLRVEVACDGSKRLRCLLKEGAAHDCVLALAVISEHSSTLLLQRVLLEVQVLLQSSVSDSYRGHKSLPLRA